MKGNTLRIITRTIAMALAGASLVTLPVAAQKAVQSDPALAEKMHQVLREHPEYILEALQIGQERQRNAQLEQQNNRVGNVRATLLAKGFGPVIGNPVGTVAIAELLDYACPFCKRAHDIVDKLAAENKSVRFTIVMRPVLGPGSETLARFALAADLQGRFVQTNDALYDKFGDDHKTPANDQNLREVASKAGVDFDRAKRDMTGDAVTKTLAKHQAIAEQMGVNGTPFFATAKTIIPGAPQSEEQLKAAAGL